MILYTKNESHESRVLIVIKKALWKQTKCVSVFLLTKDSFIFKTNFSVNRVLKCVRVLVVNLQAHTSNTETKFKTLVV